MSSFYREPDENISTTFTVSQSWTVAVLASILHRQTTQWVKEVISPVHPHHHLLQSNSAHPLLYLNYQKKSIAVENPVKSIDNAVPGCYAFLWLGLTFLKVVAHNLQVSSGSIKFSKHFRGPDWSLNTFKITPGQKVVKCLIKLYNFICN